MGTVALANPVMTAAGTAGHGVELAGQLHLSRLGAVVVKSVSAEPWAGNPAPRLHPLPAGMLNSVGLQNPGVDAWLRDDLPALAEAGATVVASVWGFTAADLEQVGRALARAVASGAVLAAVEANISCPNVEEGRRLWSQTPAGTRTALSALGEGLAGSVEVWAKLSPNVADVVEIAGAAAEAGAGAVTLVNTLAGMALDPETGRPRLGAGGGGLSGAALHPVAVRAVYDCRAAFADLPIVGVGGVASGEDAAELLAAGAQAVQVGTATFADPAAPERVLDGLVAWCRRAGVGRVGDLIGRAHGPTVTRS